MTDLLASLANWVGGSDEANLGALREGLGAKYDDAGPTTTCVCR